MNELAADLDLAVARVASGELSDEQVAELYLKFDALRARVNALWAGMKDAMVAHMTATGRDLTIGDVRYYAGTRRETKCRDNFGTLAALLEATAGDEMATSECLSSDAWKPGACRKVLLPTAFERLFETTEKPVLVEGKAKPQLLSVNERLAGSERP